MMGYYLLEHPNNNCPQYGYPRRTTHHNGQITGALVLHSAENDTDLSGADTGAEAVARYISNRSTYGSYHRIGDRDSIVKMLPFSYEAWQDTTSNNYAIGLSIAWAVHDLPRMTRKQRNAYYKTLADEVVEARDWCKAEHGIDVPIGRFKSRGEIVAGEAGLTTHSRMDPSRRSDPFGGSGQWEDEFLAVLADVVAGRDVQVEGGDPAGGSTGGGGQWPDEPMPVNGKHTAEWDRAWRDLLSAVGYAAHDDLTLAVQYWLNDLTDPSGTPYYQDFCAKDGEWGAWTNDALQRKLKDDGLYSGRLDSFDVPVFWQARGDMQISAEKRYLNDQAKYM